MGEYFLMADTVAPTPDPEVKMEKEETSCEDKAPQTLEEQIAQLLQDNCQLKELVQALNTKVDTIQSDIKEMKDQTTIKDVPAMASPRSANEKKNFKSLFGRKNEKKGKEEKKSEPKKQETKKQDANKSEKAEKSE